MRKRKAFPWHLRGLSPRPGERGQTPAGREEGKTPQVPTIADPSNLPAILYARSYKEDDIQAVAHGNFPRLIEAAWR